MKKTIVYIGNFGPEYSTENDVRKAFEAIGWNVIPIQENETNVQKIRPLAIEADLVLYTGTWGYQYIKLDEWITLVHELAEKGIPTATLHLDTFWGKSRGGRNWWLEPMFHVGEIFTADGDYQKEWTDFGKIHTFLPPAIRHDAVHVGKPRDEYRCDLAFVGSNGVGYHEDVWPYRRELVDNLRAIAKKNGWVFKNPGGDDPKINRNDDMNDFYASALVTVGDSLCLKRQNSRYWSDRVPEALGRGGFLIMPEIYALEDYDWDIPTYKWGDWQDLEKQIKYWLENDIDRVMIQKKNLEYVKQHETYKNRAQFIIDWLGIDDVN